MIEKQKWIPVDERLPDCPDCYLVTVREIWEPEEYSGTYSFVAYWDGDEWEIPEFKSFVEPLEYVSFQIKAWTEMPKPFEGEEDDQTN